MQERDAERPYRPTPRECAILLLRLFQTKEVEAGKTLTRIRLAEFTLKRLWARHRLDPDFLKQVEDWLYNAGWALFYSGRTFAAVKTTAVEGWPRLSSKRLSAELEQVSRGEFDFREHQSLLFGEVIADEDED
jgi:hypothetical protein